MPEISALDKYPCAACGAQAEWNPAKQLLVCPFCGTSSPFTVDAKRPATIVELDLAKALRELPDEERGWLTEKRTVQCQSCKAVTVFDPERVGQNCEFCGSPALVDYKEIKAPIRPQSLLPFKITQAQVREQIRSWYASKWLAPGRAQDARARRSRPRRLHPVLDVRRAGRLPVGGRSRALLLHDRDYREQRADARPARCGTCAGSRRPARSSISSTTSRCRGRRASRLRCSSRSSRFRHRARAVRHRLPVGLRRRALSGRAGRRGRAIASER